MLLIAIASILGSTFLGCLLRYAVVLESPLESLQLADEFAVPVANADRSKSLEGFVQVSAGVEHSHGSELAIHQSRVVHPFEHFFFIGIFVVQHMPKILDFGEASQYTLCLRLEEAIAVIGFLQNLCEGSLLLCLLTVVL